VTLDAAALLQRLATTGDDAPAPEEQFEILQVLRARSIESAEQVDAWVIEEMNRLRDGLIEAREYTAHFREVLGKMSATPWHPAVFLGPAVTGSVTAATVAHNGMLRVVGLAADVQLADLGVGDEVLLGQNLNVVMCKSQHPAWHAGETAEFQRALPDGRLVLKHRDEEVVVRAAHSLDVGALTAGDHVRWDRTLTLAFEKIERTRDSSLFLEDTPREGFAEIGGLDREIDRLVRAIRLPMFHPDIVRRYRLRPVTSVLLVGASGTGKTMIARAVAHWLGQHAPSGRARFMDIKPGALHSMWYSQSEANYREAFRVAREAAAAEPGVPVVMFFDEVDSIGSTRGDATGRVDDRVLNSFLAELNGLQARGNILVIAATNRRDALDPALLRPGRLGDLVLEIPRPGMAAARAIFEKHLPVGIPYAGDAGDDPARRRAIVDAAVSRLYAPNGEGDVATITFRDGTRRAVRARDLMSGANIAKISRVAVERACQRVVDEEEPGVSLPDVLDAISDEIACSVAALTPANCHAFVSGLPQDLAAVRVEPAARSTRRPHRFINVA
jgi:proteasome-associated ATPase